MIKVVVVDDELLVRLGIKSLVAWEEHGFSYAGDASDGIRAFELVKRRQPDIVLADIVMPEMNGIELLKEIKSAFPRIRVVMLSSHNDYEYLREAIRLGADDYLLKSSLRPDELLVCLQEVARKLTEGRDLLAPAPPKAGERSLLAELIREEKSEPERALLAAKLGWEMGPHVLCVIRLHGEEHLLHGGGTAYAKMLNMAEQVAVNWAQSAVATGIKPDEIVAVMPWSEPLGASDLRQLGADMIVAASRFLAVPCTVGVSPAFDSPAELRAAYGRASEAVQRFFYEGTGRVYECGAAPEREAVPGAAWDTEQLQQALGRLDAEAVKEELHSLFDRLYRERPGLAECNQRMLEWLGPFQSLLKEVRLDLSLLAEKPGTAVYEQVIAFDGLDRARAWFERFAGACCRVVRERKANMYSSEIVRLLEFVELHYNEPISLARAARHVHLSEGYLGHLFKKETGKNFVEYITDLRMQKAQDYLRHTDLPSYAIAQKLGYENINYFGRCFKKKTGFSPNRFREMARAKPSRD